MPLLEPEHLRPHRLNADVYGAWTDAGLLESIRAHGILTPLLVTRDNVIISGHRRWKAACVLGIETVPVVVFGSDDPLDIEAALIESNRQRLKTTEQRAREFMRLKEIEAERAQRRQAENAERLNAERRGDGANPANLRDSRERGESSVLAAKKVGMGARTAEKSAEVVKAADALAAQGQAAEAKALTDVLNGQSVHAAYSRAQRQGLLAPPAAAGTADAPPAARPGAPLLALQTHTGETVPYPQPQSAPVFNQTQGPGISWAKWSWNPVTGCLHGCDYCYAREIATSERTRAAFPVGFTPLFHSERLAAPLNTVLPEEHRAEAAPCEPFGCPWRRVFVCSMADLYGRWVPDDWIARVHAAMLAATDWEYLLLTKFPGRYVGLELPPNAWVGTSVDEQKRVHLAEDAFRRIHGVRVKWLSLEPLREALEFSDLRMFDWVVIGAQTRTVQPTGVVEAFAPPFEWVARLVVQAQAAGCKVHLKPNLFGVPGMQPLNEYPTW